MQEKPDTLPRPIRVQKSVRREFRRLMALRKDAHPSDKVWLTNAARKLAWIMGEKPANEWSE